MPRSLLGMLLGREIRAPRSTQRRLSRRVGLGLEWLEARKLMTGDVYLDSSGGLHVWMTNDGDKAHVFVDYKTPDTSADDVVGVKWVHDNITSNYAFKVASVKKIYVSGGLGDDTATNDTNIKSSMNGNTGEDVLTGGSSDDEIYGGDDEDVIDGRGGNDRLYGGFGTDTVHGGFGNDVLYASTANTQGNGDIYATDHLYGDGDNDRMLGAGSATNYMDGGDGNDVMVGGTGAYAANSMFGGKGDDALYSFGDINNLNGGAGRDYLEVQPFGGVVNTLFGGDDKDMDVFLVGEGNSALVIARKEDFILHTQSKTYPTI